MYFYRIKLIFSAAMVFLLLPYGTLLAGNSTPSGVQFVVFNFTSNGIETFSGGRSASIVKNILGEESGFSITQASPESYSSLTSSLSCTEDCMAKLQDEYPGAVLVLGFVEKLVIKTGEVKVSEYVTKNISYDQFKLNVKTINLVNGKVETSFYKECGDENTVYTEILAATKIIKNYYLKKMKSDAVQAAALKEAEGGFINGITLMPSYFYTLDKYSNMAGSGYGLSADINFTRMEKSYFFLLNAGGYKLSDLRSNVKEVSVFPVFLCGGYNLDFTPLIGTSFFAGAGYAFQVISGKSNGVEVVDGLYYNPAVQAGLDLHINISKSWRIIFRPAYSVFFTPDEYLSSLMFNLGLRMEF